MATIYQCMYRYDFKPTQQCSTFNQGKRDKCLGCKSTIRAITGHAVLVPWRGDSRYEIGQAVKEYATISAAEKAAARAYESDNNSNLVARFLV